ncbi:MAG: Rieske (2Fe-2S) protein [candidate division WOR-3 bacterium]
MKRRDFLNYIFKGTIFAWFLGIIGSILSFIKLPKIEREEFEKEIEIKGANELAPWEYKFIPHLKEPLFFIKTETGFIAISAVCTHMKCILEYKKEERMINCPCHGALFDLNGNPLKGPPSFPLKRYEIEKRGDKFYVIL